MKWKEYKKLSKKTLSTEFHCKGSDKLMLHAVMGILTEIDELLENHSSVIDEVNRVEEIGDIAWYMAIIGREYNLEIPDNVTTSLSDNDVVITIIKNSLKLLDILKKKIFYNRPINTELFVQYSKEIFSLIIAYANIHGVDIESGFDTNIAKLKSRYGSKFTSERAINRNLETERAILEGNDSTTGKI